MLHMLIEELYDAIKEAGASEEKAASLPAGRCSVLARPIEGFGISVQSGAPRSWSLYRANLTPPTPLKDRSNRSFRILLNAIRFGARQKGPTSSLQE